MASRRQLDNGKLAATATAAVDQTTNELVGTEADNFEGEFGANEPEDNAVEASAETDEPGDSEGVAEDGDSEAIAPSGVRPLLAPPVALSQQAAIALINRDNHDLVTLLGPLFSSSITAKRLKATFKQLGLTDAEGAEWVASVKQLFETKQQTYQALIRGLIAE